jgi:hypothetical protein
LLLRLLFPPKLGKIAGHDTVFLLLAIREGRITPVPPEPPESGIGRVFEWSNNRWNQIRRPDPYYRFRDELILLED